MLYSVQKFDDNSPNVPVCEKFTQFSVCLSDFQNNVQVTTTDFQCDKFLSVPQLPQNFLSTYDMCNNNNEHNFASHLSYSPTYRFSTVTFMCEIISECDSRMNIRCALDTMSNVSILRRSIADALNLKGPKCDLQLGVTGGQVITFKKQRKVSFRLGGIRNSYVSDFLIEAATIPTISQQFERILVDPSEYEYLSGLDFTEPLPMTDEHYEATKMWIYSWAFPMRH